MYMKLLLLLSVILLPQAYSAVSKNVNFKSAKQINLEDEKDLALQMIKDGRLKASYALMLDEETQEPTCFIDLAERQDLTPDFMQPISKDAKSNIQLRENIPQCDSNEEMEVAYMRDHFVLEGTQTAGMIIGGIVGAGVACMLGAYTAGRNFPSINAGRSEAKIISASSIYASELSFIIGFLTGAGSGANVGIALGKFGFGIGAIGFGAHVACNKATIYILEQE